MLPVFTLVVVRVPHVYTAELAPSTGEVVTIDEGGAKVRAVRGSDGGGPLTGEFAIDRA